MSKMLLINGGNGKLRKDFLNSCLDNNIECKPFRAGTELLITIDKEGLNLYVNNELLNLEDIGYAFIRVKGKYTQATTLLATILSLREIDFNDRVNTEYTENDEKITQMVKFGISGIPIPVTSIFTRESYINNKETILGKHIFPCVLKINGSKGRAVWKIDSEEDLEKKLSLNVPEFKSAMLQEYIKNTHDIRALYFEGDLIKAIERYSIDGFYNNVAMGGKTIETELTDEEDSICKNALSVIKTDFGGVDFIRTDNGMIFLEINTGPQVYGLEEATGICVPEVLIKRIKAKYLK